MQVTIREKDSILVDRASIRIYLKGWQLAKISCLCPENLGKAVLFCTLVAITSAGAATQPQFQRLYDHYFPKNDKYQNGEYRQWFDAELFGSPPKPGEDRHQFYSAFQGDPSAFHAFVNHPDRRVWGEFGLTWIKECLVLLLRLGDDGFSKLLAREDGTTREMVGAAIEQQVNWTKHSFPKTRVLYDYRYILPSHQAFEKKHGKRLSLLTAAIAADKRFVDVRFYNRNEATPAVRIVAPKSLRSKDKDDLQRLIQRYLGSDAALSFR